jgi:type VI secretion system protein ImpM
MVGVLKPSQDQYNRRFPLVAAAILPIESLEGGTEIFPIAFEVFFDGLREQVENAVDNSVEAIACRQFLETQLAPYDKTGADIELAEIVAKRFMATHTVAYLDEILRVGNPAASLEQAVLNLVFYQSHLRRFDNAVTNQVIVLPLGSNAGERPLLAATWLTLLSALINSDSADMGMKISYIHTHRLSNNASIAINIGKISDGFVCAMLGNMGNDGVVLDMTSEHEAWKSHRMYAEVSYALGRLLSNGDLSLTALVEFVGDVGKKLEANV